MNLRNQAIYNAHLEGEDFFWKSGKNGVLLIHGFTATTSEIRPLAKFLYDKGFSVSGPLLPGHNTKPEDLNFVHWKDWVESVKDSYLELKETCENIVIGGESTGGLIALYLASQYPEIKAILAYAPALRLNLPLYKLWQIRILSNFNYMLNKDPMEDDKYWQGYYSYPLKGAKQLLDLQNEVKIILSKISQPILIVQGKLDPTVHPKVPSIINNKVGSTKKEIVWMEKSKHCVVIDQEMDEVAKITLNFLESVLKN
jgi:carboxylesterase